MNIKITIKDGDAKPLLVHKNQLSEVEFKKKNSLYQQPQKDRNTSKKEKAVVPSNKTSRDEKGLRQTGLRSSGQQQARQLAEKKMMQDLDKMSKNQASLEMVHNSNNILQKQNQILYENQRAIQSMVRNSNDKQNLPSKNQNEEVEGMLRNIKKEVDEMRRIKQEIERTGKEFAKTVSDANKTGKQVTFQGVSNVAEMNSNLKNLADISKNQLDGLENLQAIKNLQNFNIEGYSQAINGLKRQIVQYQKESQQIERELKLRAAKLQQLDVAPNFNEQLLAPYEQYLKKKAESIDLHAIKDRIYEKIGHFDYGKFEYDVSQVMAEVKGELKQFDITCRQYRVCVPDIKLDARELKNLELKLPNALDEYKAERGIDFAQTSKQLNQTEQLGESRAKKRKMGQPVIFGTQVSKKPKGQKMPQAVRQLNSKPIDLSAQVKYQKTNEPTQKTILQNQRENDKKEVQRNIKKGKVKKQEDFQKYLEYRAQEELEALYKEKEQRLKKMKNDLLQTCKQEPEVYLNLNLQNQIRREVSVEKKKEEPQRQEQIKKQIIKKQVESEEKELKPVYGHEGEAIKAIGTEVLKEKLKNILGQANQRRQYQPQAPPAYNQNIPQPPQKLQNIAENFLALINNTLTQVNSQISNTIQTKFEQRSLSKEKRQYERRSPPKIQIPKLEQFRAPPMFNNMKYANTNANEGFIATQPSPKIPEQKIVPKSYEHLKIEGSQNYADLEISDSYQQDFQ